MTISTSSQASAGSLSLFDGTEDVLECSVKSNHSVSESSQNTGRESLSSETSEISREPDTEERGFSPEAFLASHSVAPGSERARKMTVSSGLRCVESYGKHNPNGCWQRMFLASLVKTEAWFSSVCLLTWKMQATKRSRLLFRLAALALPIEEIGSGLLQSPKAAMPEENGAEMINGRFYRQTGSDFGPNLATQIALLKTPSAVETEGGIMEIRPGANAHYKLRDQIAMLTTPTGSVVADGMKSPGLKLQPGFALWMMGYPEDWCDLKDGE